MTSTRKKRFQEISRALCNERIKNTQTEKLIQASPSTVNTAKASAKSDEEFFPMQQKNYKFPTHTFSHGKREEMKIKTGSTQLVFVAL